MAKTALHLIVAEAYSPYLLSFNLLRKAFVTFERFPVVRHSPTRCITFALVTLSILAATPLICFGGPSGNPPAQSPATAVSAVADPAGSVASVAALRKRTAVFGPVALLPSLMDMARAWAARLNADPRGHGPTPSPEASLKVQTAHSTQQGNGSLTDLRNGYSAGNYTGVTLTRQLTPKLSGTFSRKTNDSGSVYGLTRSKTASADVVAALGGNRTVGVGFTDWRSTDSPFGGAARQRNAYVSFQTSLGTRTNMTIDCGVMSSHQDDIGVSQARYAGIGLQRRIARNLSLGAAFRRNAYSSYNGSQTPQSGNAMGLGLYWTPSAKLAIGGMWNRETVSGPSPTRFASPSLSVHWDPSPRTSLTAQLDLARFSQGDGLTNGLSSQRAGGLSLSLSRKLSADRSLDLACDLAAIAGSKSALGGYGISYRSKL